VLVDGTLHAELAGALPDDVKLELRTLRAKAADESAPDVWSRWQTLFSGPGRATVELGRRRFNGRDVSITGVYRFQIRVAVNPQAGRTMPAGLSGLDLELYFENGIMSIPQIFAGANTIQFQLRDAAQLRGPVRVTYTYQTARGERAHTQILHAQDFHTNVARYSFHAPGLVRCKSLSITY